MRSTNRRVEVQADWGIKAEHKKITEAKRTGV
jgi:hypothetical protein